MIVNNQTIDQILLLDPDFLSNALELLPSPVLISKHTQGKTIPVYLNKAFQHIIGYTKEEIDNIQNWYHLAYPDPLYRSMVIQRWAKNETPKDSTSKICCKDGKYRWFDVRTNFKGIYNFVVFLDINNIEAQKQELQALNLFKQNVFSILSHDLRSPFNNTLGLITMLEQAVQKNSLTEIQSYLSMIKQSASTGLALLEDLLEMAQIEENQIIVNKQEINVEELFFNLQKKFSFETSQKSQKIEIQIFSEKKIQADQNKTTQILSNLISNSIKYSQYGQKILLSYMYRHEKHILSVTDFGQGFTSEDENKMFGKFQKLSAKPTSGEKSTGIGLYICKILAESQGAQLTAESPGKNMGATFSLIFS